MFAAIAVLLLTLHVPRSSSFFLFRSAYSHRYSSPEILKNLRKSHGKKWFAGVSLVYPISGFAISDCSEAASLLSSRVWRDHACSHWQSHSRTAQPL